MRRQFFDLLPVAIAIGVGIVVLLGQFIQNGIVHQTGDLMIAWATMVASFAVLLGLVNVLTVHMQRMVRREAGAWASIFILASALIVFLIVLPSGGADSASNWVLHYIYQPLDTAFLALLVFFMATAAYRALRIRTWETALFVISALIVLIGAAPITTTVAPWLANVYGWVMNVPAVAGVRGIALGVALGVIATGLRLLTGIDRPYTE